MGMIGEERNCMQQNKKISIRIFRKCSYFNEISNQNVISSAQSTILGFMEIEVKIILMNFLSRLFFWGTI